jgi:hypothetical protein
MEVIPVAGIVPGKTPSNNVIACQKLNLLHAAEGNREGFESWQ